MWGLWEVSRSWEKRTQRASSPLLPCEVTMKRWPSMNQNARLTRHQICLIPWPQTFLRLRTVRNTCLLFKPPNTWHVVIAAGMDQHTGLPKARVKTMLVVSGSPISTFAYLLRFLCDHDIDSDHTLAGIWGGAQSTETLELPGAYVASWNWTRQHCLLVSALTLNKRPFCGLSRTTFFTFCAFCWDFTV